MRDDLLFQLARPGEPESALLPGMAVRNPLGVVGSLDLPPLDIEAAGYLGGFPNLWDSSLPGPPTQPGPPAPGRWVYDFDPATGVCRATYAGEVSYSGSGGNVTSWNGRAGAVTMTTADITSAGGATAAQLGNYLPLAGGTLSGALTINAALDLNGNLVFGTGDGIVGITNGSNAVAGDVGEVITATQPVGQGLATNVVYALTVINLSPGDWDCYGVISFAPAAANMTSMAAGLNTVNNAMPTFYQTIYNGSANFGGSQLATPYYRFNVTTPTNIFLLADAGFATTCLATGAVWARRAR